MLGRGRKMSKTRVCDKCKTHSKVHTNTQYIPNWVVIQLSFGSSRGGKQFDICPTCAVKLGIEKEEKIKSLGDQLSDIFYEIAEEVASNE